MQPGFANLSPSWKCVDLAKDEGKSVLFGQVIIW